MTALDQPADIVQSGPGSGRRRPVAALLAILAGLVAVGWYLDHRSRQDEYVALRQCADTASAAVADATARVSFMAEYVRPAMSSAEPAVTDGLYRLVARAAQPVRAEVDEARASCAAVAIRPWHRQLGRARASELVYLDAESAMFRSTSSDGRAFFGSPDERNFRHFTAVAALAAAEPGPP